MTTSVVSVTEFKAHCLDVIRQVERGAACVELTRRGKVVARLVPAETAAQADAPWLSLRGLGALHAQPEESVLDAAEFDAAR
jgi:prevent-host-death family protein